MKFFPCFIFLFFEYNIQCVEILKKFVVHRKEDISFTKAPEKRIHTLKPVYFPIGAIRDREKKKY